ncbi:unnamed protein product [Porites evermanni]|uniref:Uncharacterized protein n=1 Tax=Porites evermanni TaxID=104178 RepID=A0ABN8SZR7_9CNID|nr:unnamed protein product [Porites evermanni]
MIVVRRKSIYNSQFLTKVTANSVFDAWPVIVITLVMTLLAGIVMWILVAVVANSTEHKIAIKRLRNKIKLGPTFSDLTSMTQALKSSDVSYVLLDMYVPVTRKDLFNGTWFDVVDILEGEIQHGVLLQGDGVRLAQTMKNLLIKDDIQTKFLIEAGASETSETEKTSFVFFEPSSPYYLITMIISAGLLIIATICGLFYQNLCYKRRLREMDEEDPCSCGEKKRDITKSVKAFYFNFSQTYHRLRRKH